MRLAYYAGASTAAAAACLLKAFHQRPNFYSATVYLSQSNACLLILTNLILVLVCSFIYALQRLLYGPLRPIEIEQLSEKAWYAVLDTLLAMPSFREDVGGWLLAMFVLLLAGKVWGWIGEGRVDVLEQQPPANPNLFHIRLATSLAVSVAFDLWMLDYCVGAVLADLRPGMMVIFTFEFAILSVFSMFTLARYFLTLIQTRVEREQMKKAIDDRKNEIRAERAAARQNETEDGRPAPADPPSQEPIEVDENEVDVPGWEEKRRYLFALEVFTDFVKLMIYIVFFTVSITFNGLPMHIMRDVYMTFASFSKRLSDYVAYRKATSDMNTRYPDATTEEIRGDSCIVCRETMVAWDQPDAQAPGQPGGDQPPAAPAPARRRDEGLRAKKLLCGHILHLRCLKAWLERQQVCPTCRRPVVTVSAPGVPGQPNAGGANPAAPGQEGQPRPQRQGHARILNFGPVRIGFLNGPGDQIGNIVRQMQNPQAGAAGQNGVQDPDQQGPNHLGLQVPYPGGPQGATRSAPTGARAAVPTQIQLMQIEQRIMQEAHNLGLEQQQLGTLRVMEAELARLRAAQESAETATGAQRQAAPQMIQLPPMQLPGFMPFPPPIPFQQPFMPAPLEAFHSNQTQQFGNGHESLPQGMTLPQGWTVMPLQRAEGMGVPQINIQPVDMQTNQAEGPPAVASAVNGTIGPSAPPSDPVQSSAAPQQDASPAAGPTDERGSPLFVPVAPATNDDAAVTTTSQPSTAQPAPPADAADSSQQSYTETEHKPPSGSEGGWSFGDQPNGHVTSDEQASSAQGQNGALPESEHEQQSYSGKGKGKAVEVEDAPDHGD